MITSSLRAIALLLLTLVCLATLTGEVHAQPASDLGRPDTAILIPPSPSQTPPSIADTNLNYISPVTAAAKPFTHMLLRWDATLPITDGLHLEARVSSDNSTWSTWNKVPENLDVWQPSDGLDTYWSEVMYAGEGARFWQVRAITMPAPDGTLATLRKIEVNTVDARFASTNAQQSVTGEQIAGLGKPAVVSRTSWGSPDGEGSRVKPVYYPVNHMVVHHTADSNSLTGSEKNWGDRVRAEWSFHTFTRGWGDVGYNYLIAPDGVIYEGRAGGDDVIAFHDTANYGSMGVVLIGTYSSVQPTAAAQASLVSLLSWKANQKDIDPLGRSYYYGCAISSYCRPYTTNAIVENIAGHRQVTPGHTTCPGDSTIDLLPSIRNRVKQQLAGGNTAPTPDNGDLLIDELESTFTRSNASWYDAACGYGGHTFYTYTTDKSAESTNSGTWRPTLAVAGRYHIYAHIPQNCGLGQTPYASTKAAYTIHSSGGDVRVVADHNSSDEWADLGVYTFNAGSDGTITLNDLTGEPYSARRVLFFDSVKWVPEAASNASVDLLNVRYDRTSLAAGELLKVTFTVRNSGSVAIAGQSPQSGTLPDGSFDLANGYVYDEDECYIGNSSGDYPTFPKETDRFRVTLGALESAPPCVGSAGGYPWRWGIDGDLAPGQQRDVVGYVRFRTPGTRTLQAGVVQEYVRYHAQSAALASITVTPEKIAPSVAVYDTSLQPQAQVYTLGSIPDNFLARTTDPFSIPRGDYVGSFAWDGSRIDWGDNGPLGLNDGFLVEQTRVFRASTAGSYTFRTTSDDGSWLWVDGASVVVNNGLHSDQDITGTVTLAAGPHVLAFKYFERTGPAVAGYSVRAPEQDSYAQPIDDLGSSAFHLGSSFAASPDLTLAADDGGGSGIDRISYTLDGSTWIDTAGSLAHIGRLGNGSYAVRYHTTDKAGNTSTDQELHFTVNADLKVYQALLPIALK